MCIALVPVVMLPKACDMQYKSTHGVGLKCLNGDCEGCIAGDYKVTLGGQLPLRFAKDAHLCAVLSLHLTADL